jgi:PAS domain S-box-containing protein
MGNIEDLQGRISKLEALLKEAEQEQKSMLENFPSPAWIKNLEGQYIHANSLFLELHNTSLPSFIGQAAIKILPADIAQLEEYTDKAVIADKKKHTYQRKRKESWYSVTISPVLNSKNDVTGITGYEQLINENIETLNALRYEKEFLQVLMDYIPYTIYFKDLDCRFTKINKAQARLIGLDNPKEAIGKTDFDFFSDQHAQAAFEDERKIMTTGIPLLEKIEHIKDADGKLRWVSATKIPVYDDNDKITGLVGMSMDITEKRMAEDKLREAKEKAEESDRLKTAFLANMSHEIRTPMNGIIGFSNLLRNPELTEEERSEFISHITNCGSSLLNLIDDIIDISKIEAGQIKIRISESHINAILDEIYESFEAIRQREGKEQIKLKKNITISDNYTVIMTDPFRLRQIMSNLIGNALKFTLDGYVEFGYTLQDESTLLFSVKDTGIGIPKDKQELIFERFGQVIDSNYYINQKGTGLGLAISSNLVKLLGGNMWVESEPGEGSTFYFTLPYKVVDNAQHKSETEMIEGETLVLTGKTILIADNEDTNYLYYKEILKTTKARIIWVKNGLAAVEIVKLNPEISLVLMDIKMPKMDGYTATKQIKSINKNIHVIAQTAFAMADEQEKSIQAGCSAYLSKPINTIELFAVIKKFIT